MVEINITIKGLFGQKKPHFIITCEMLDEKN